MSGIETPITETPLTPAPLAREERGSDATRADELFAVKRQAIIFHADRLFGCLLVVQYLAAIAAAVWISPLAWEGDQFAVHVHVWTALILGAFISSVPVALALLRPGCPTTRHLLAMGQMLMGALLIHLTGGRIETHFHVFGSLALLSVYRDWRVLVSATMVVAADHFLRGLWWPRSVFGDFAASNWRWLEHAGWVVFEDIFLIYYCMRGLRELKALAMRQAELEETNAGIECTVHKRTSELAAANLDLRHQAEARRHAEAEAARRQTELADYIENATVGLHQVGSDGIILWANRAELELLGYRHEEYVGRHISEFHADAEVIASILNRLGQGEVLREEPARLRCKDGSIRHVLIDSCVYMEDGVFKHTRCFTRDVTARTRSEDALRESEERFRNMADHASVIIRVTEADGNCAFISQSWVEFTGQSTAAALGSGWADMIHPDDRSQAVTSICADTARHERFHLDYRLRTQAGGCLWVNDTGIPRFGPSGEFLGYIASMVDITDRKETEAALRESRERQRLAVQATNLGPWDLDLSTREVYFSPEWKRQIGYQDHEIPNRYEEWESRLHPEDRERVLKALQICENGDGPEYEVEFRLGHKNGSYRWMYTRAMTLRDAKGKPIRMLGCHVDITERKRAEEELRASVREKEALLKEIHHRVKNDLQIISSLLNLQIPKIKDAESLAAFEDSQNRVRSMALIHETLYCSGNLAGIDLKCYLDSLCAHLYRTYGVDASRIQLTIDVADVPLNLDQAIPCGLIINELVSNSLKYAFPDKRSGHITVAAREGDQGKFLLAVSDTGVGIPAGLDLEQLDSLGLNLVTDLTGQLGGSLKIKREGGAAFSINFPMAN